MLETSGRVFPPVTSEPLLRIGGERYVVIDQVGMVDQSNRGTEPACADPSVPQAVAPDHTYHVGLPPAPDTVQDPANDANIGGRPDDDEVEYAEYSRDPDKKSEDIISPPTKSEAAEVQAPATSDVHKPESD